MEIKGNGVSVISPQFYNNHYIKLQNTEIIHIK